MAKKKHEEHENHERWLVSYADFITLLFAFFVVMYSVSSVNEGKYRTVSDSIKAALNPVNSIPSSRLPFSIGDTKPKMIPPETDSINDPVIRRMREIVTRINLGLKGDIAEVKIIETGHGAIMISLPESILFQSGEARVRSEALPLLKALADVLAPADPANPGAPRAVLVKAGQQVPGFAMLRDDGSTACGNWLYSGCWSEAGNLTARRGLDDPSGLGVFQHFGFAWPANRRILYNRASADKDGKPWAPNKKYEYWNGKAWTGPDVPDMRPNAAPEENVGSFIMNPEGVARLHAIGMAEGPFPEHYEPFETPIGVNPLHPDNPLAISNPAARVFKGDLEAFGKKEEFPYSATTYRLTEHFHTWTKHARLNAITQPEAFVEISEELAKEKGLKHGDRVKVSSNRGHIITKAVVTKRIKPFAVNGQQVHLVGIPFHWGFKGQTKNGYIANTLTPFVGDANSQTPESKAFLVNIEKV
jgi:hypothetical protein